MARGKLLYTLHLCLVALSGICLHEEMNSGGTGVGGLYGGLFEEEGASRE